MSAPPLVWPTSGSALSSSGFAYDVVACDSWLIWPSTVTSQRKFWPTPWVVLQRIVESSSTAQSFAVYSTPVGPYVTDCRNLTP